MGVSEMICWTYLVRMNIRPKMQAQIHYFANKVDQETCPVSHGEQDMAATDHGSHIPLVPVELSSLPKP